jgi:Family of unknown function (DUF6220)
MAEATHTTSRELTGARRQVDVAFNYVALLFVVGIFVQIYLAGVGVFGDHSHKVADANSFDPHRAVGEILGLIAVVMLILSLIARRSRDVIIGSLLLAILVEVAQHGLAAAGDDHKWVGGLHALDGLIILGVGGWLYHATRRT